MKFTAEEKPATNSHTLLIVCVVVAVLSSLAELVDVVVMLSLS